MRVGLPGLCLLSQPWQESPTTAFLRWSSSAYRGPIYINLPDFLYLLGMTGARPVPARSARSEGARAAAGHPLSTPWLETTSGYLVWYNVSPCGGNQVGIDEVRRATDLTPPVQFADGTVFRVSRPAPSGVR